MNTLRRSRLLVLLVVVSMGTLGCATQRHLDRGRAALLSDDPVTARYHFEQALSNKPKLIQKSDFAAEYHVARRDAAVVEGQEALRDDSPFTAIERFEFALSVEPGWPAAEQGLTQAHGDAADFLHRKARDAADRGDLHDARAHLTKALEHQPDHGPASTALASLDLPEASQPEAYRRALQLIKQRRWYEARDALAESTAHDPDFLPARAAKPGLLQQAGDDYLRVGQLELADERFDAADAAFLAVLDFQPGRREVHTALALVDATRGHTALSNDLPGQALLHYREALQHHASEDVRASIQRVKATLRSRHRPSVHLDSDTSRDTAQRLLDQTQHELQRYADTLTAATAGQPVSIRLDDLSIPSPTVKTESRRHAYDVPYDVPNPDLPILEARLRRIARNVESLKCDADQLHAQYQAAIHCNDPNAGFIQGRLRSVQHDLDRARRDHQRVSHELACAPAFITRIRVEYWPYTLYRHTRRASLTTTFAVDGRDTRQIEATFSETDTTLDNARPDLGLRADPLVMKDDAAVEKDLVTQASKRLASTIHKTLLSQTVQQLQARAKAMPTGDPAARELRVAAAVLLEAIDTSAADQLLATESQ